MILSSLLKFLYEHWIAALITGAVVFLLNNKYGQSLNKYPGPAAAAYTNFWRLFAVWARNGHETQYQLSKKYGSVVRIGPNFLLFNDPEAIKDIYGLKPVFRKTELYRVFQATARGHRIPSMFSSIDEAYHARLRRCVSNAFAMSTLVSYEPLVNRTIEAFLDQTSKRFAVAESETTTTPTCNFSQWLQFFAFDVIGELAWSKRLGFIDQNRDVDGIIQNVDAFLMYGSVAGQMPWIDRLLLDKNPIKMLLGRLGLQNNSSGAANFALARWQEREHELAALKATSPSKPKDAANTTDSDAGSDSEHSIDTQADREKGTDFLSRFMHAQSQHPDFMTDARVLAATISLIFAGSDTTATSLSAIFYHLLRHPAALATLRSELAAAEESGLIPRRAKTVSYATAATHLPYLDAVIQEAFRLTPALALPQERYVPAGGATIAGHRVPGGTTVGVNAFIVQRDPRVFAPDPDAFRPERWLRAEAEALAEMRGAMFQFGGGARACVGRHISTLEIYKLVPSLLRRFDVHVVGGPAREWRVVNCWFLKVFGFEVRFSERRREKGEVLA